jgi:hypothetical protein
VPQGIEITSVLSRSETSTINLGTKVNLRKPQRPGKKKHAFV